MPWRAGVTGPFTCVCVLIRPGSKSILEDLGAQPGPRQAVMVRRLAKLQKVEEKISAMDKVLVKPTAPVARVVTNQDIPPKK